MMDNSRRQALRCGAGLVFLSLSGCTKLKKADDEQTVSLTVINRSDVERTVEIRIESESETVFEGSYDLPAPKGSAGSVSEKDVIEAGQYTVSASNGVVTREFQYKSTCESVDDTDDEIFVTVRSDAHLDISSTYCGN